MKTLAVIIILYFAVFYYVLTSTIVWIGNLG